MLDESGSIGAESFKKMLDFTAKVASVFTVGTGDSDSRVGAVSFASTANTEFLPGVHSTNAAVNAAIKGIRQEGGGTETSAGLSHVLNLFNSDDSGVRPKSKEAARVVILITDGQSNSSPQAAAEAIRATGAVVFAVGVAGYTSPPFEALPVVP